MLNFHVCSNDHNIAMNNWPCMNNQIDYMVYGSYGQFTIHDRIVHNLWSIIHRSRIVHRLTIPWTIGHTMKYLIYIFLNMNRCESVEERKCESTEVWKCGSLEVSKCGNTKKNEEKNFHISPPSPFHFCATSVFPPLCNKNVAEISTLSS